MKIVEIQSYNEFKNINSNYKLSFIQIGATWCGPCKKIKPLIEEYMKNLEENDIVFIKIDYDELEEDEELKELIKVEKLPYITIYNKIKCDEGKSTGDFEEMKKYIENKLEKKEELNKLEMEDDF